MATVTTHLSSEKAHQFLDGHVAVAENQADFSSTVACAADVIRLLTMPQGALVLDFRARINTAEGGTCTGDFGDGDDPNGYDDGVNLNATAATMTATVKGTDAYAVGKVYTAEDTIDLTLDNDADALILDVFAVYAVVEKYAE